jgi:hypothetical protein
VEVTLPKEDVDIAFPEEELEVASMGEVVDATVS